ncbi:hypothetical protein USB125703_01100 [Pseudoclavibacter triregionum]|nr:hypothetical protein USB125703_01100 [Pseudoclavibacter triregionum]
MIPDDLARGRDAAPAVPAAWLEPPAPLGAADGVDAALLEAGRARGASDEAIRDAVLALVGATSAEDVASWSALVDRCLRLGRVDAALARLSEGHLDALRVLRELGAEPEPGALYGVWASKSRGSGWRAEPEGEGAWRIDGTLRFASGAGLLDRALTTVPGERPDDDAQLLLDLDVSALRGDEGSWRTEAMARSRSLDLEGDGVVVAGRRIGGPGAYLGRWGFLPGGAGVAACWAGGIARLMDVLADRLRGQAAAGREPGELQLARLGGIRVEAASSAALCRRTGAMLDRLAAADAEAGAAAELAALCRAGVALSGRRALELARPLAGASALAHEDALIQAVADLELYLAQHPHDLALAGLGRRLLDGPGA